jgi:hypothetical protein
MKIAHFWHTMSFLGGIEGFNFFLDFDHFERFFAQKVVILSHFREMQHCHFRAKITLFRPKWLKMVFF